MIRGLGWEIAANRFISQTRSRLIARNKHELNFNKSSSDTITFLHIQSHSRTHLHSLVHIYLHTHTITLFQSNTHSQSRHSHSHMHIHIHSLAHTHTHTHTQRERETKPCLLNIPYDVVKVSLIFVAMEKRQSWKRIWICSNQVSLKMKKNLGLLRNLSLLNWQLRYGILVILMKWWILRLLLSSL